MYPFEVIGTLNISKSRAFLFGSTSINKVALSKNSCVPGETVIRVSLITLVTKVSEIELSSPLSAFIIESFAPFQTKSEFSTSRMLADPNVLKTIDPAVLLAVEVIVIEVLLFMVVMVAT